MNYGRETKRMKCDAKRDDERPSNHLKFVFVWAFFHFLGRFSFAFANCKRQFLFWLLLNFKEPKNRETPQPQLCDRMINEFWWNYTQLFLLCSCLTINARAISARMIATAFSDILNLDIFVLSSSSHMLPLLSLLMSILVRKIIEASVESASASIEVVCFNTSTLGTAKKKDIPKSLSKHKRIGWKWNERCRVFGVGDGMWTILRLNRKSDEKVTNKLTKSQMCICVLFAYVSFSMLSPLSFAFLSLFIHTIPIAHVANILQTFIANITSFKRNQKCFFFFSLCCYCQCYCRCCCCCGRNAKKEISFEMPSREKMFFFLFLFIFLLRTKSLRWWNWIKPTPRWRRYRRTFEKSYTRKTLATGKIRLNCVILKEKRACRQDEKFIIQWLRWFQRWTGKRANRMLGKHLKPIFKLIQRFVQLVDWWILNLLRFQSLVHFSVQNNQLEWSTCSIAVIKHS